METLALNSTNWESIKTILDNMCAGETDSGFTLIEDGDWIHEGKSQYREVVFQDLSDKRFYRFFESRSGSPFTDWHYDGVFFGDVEEVEKREIITTEWKTKVSS